MLYLDCGDKQDGCQNRVAAVMRLQISAAGEDQEFAGIAHLAGIKLQVILKLR